jgi:hypothetical protein
MPWPKFGQAEQSHAQTSDELRSLVEAADFKGMKIQIRRYDFMVDI